MYSHVSLSHSVIPKDVYVVRLNSKVLKDGQGGWIISDFPVRSTLKFIYNCVYINCQYYYLVIKNLKYFSFKIGTFFLSLYRTIHLKEYGLNLAPSRNDHIHSAICVRFNHWRQTYHVKYCSISHFLTQYYHQTWISHRFESLCKPRISVNIKT